jgi:MFS family permease
LLAVRFTFSGILTSTTILWLSLYVDGGVTIHGALLPLATLTGVFSAARVLAGTAGGPLFGSLSDLGRNRWMVLALLMLTGAAGIVLMTLPWLGVGLVGALLAAVTASGVTGICAALVGDHVPLEMQSRGLGLVYTVGDIGAMLGPVVALALVTEIGVRQVYSIGAGLYGLAAILALVMASSKAQRTGRPA